MTTATGDHQDLLHRIEAVPLDQPGASLPFSARLARDNGWSVGYAERVVAEYRRFVFLAAVAGHPVTPSDEVDQAWHLHLVYTRSYWDELCGEVLGFPLHHGPTVGGPAEGEKFTDWYERTLDSYRRLFDEEPPADVWPPSRQRFADADRFRRVNTAERWVIRKPELLQGGGRRRLGPVLVAGAALALTGCLAAAGTNPAILASASASSEDGGGLTEWSGVIVIAVVVAAIVVAMGRLQRRLRRRGDGVGYGGGAGQSGWFGRDSGGGGCGSSGCGSSGCGSSGCGGGGCGS